MTTVQNRTEIENFTQVYLQDVFFDPKNYQHRLLDQGLSLLTVKGHHLPRNPTDFNNFGGETLLLIP